MRSVPPVLVEGLTTPLVSVLLVLLSPPLPPESPVPPHAATARASAAPTATRGNILLIWTHSSFRNVFEKLARSVPDQRVRGSRASRRPSPNRLKARTVTKIARPGTIMNQGSTE